MSFSKRKNARYKSVQALYQMELNPSPLESLLSEFLSNSEHLDTEYFQNLVKSILAKKETLDEYYLPFIDREFDEVRTIERVILRQATYELLYEEIPHKVVINEALELSKLFGANEAHKFVNAVLDKLSKKLQS